MMMWFTEMNIDDIDSLYKKCPQNEKVLIDVKGIFKEDIILNQGYSYWRL